MNYPFVIRTAANEDLPAIRSVIHEVRLEYEVLGDGGVDDPDLQNLARSYFDRGGHFEVIECVDRRIVGCAGLYPLTAIRAELCKMYLRQEARGRGLGKTLLQNLLAAARRNGFGEVWLETNSVLTTATALYRRYGFQPVPSDHLLPRCDEAYLLRLD